MIEEFSQDGCFSHFLEEELYPGCFADHRRWLKSGERKHFAQISSIVEQLALAGDARLFDKKKGGARAIELNERDNVWILKTRIPESIRRHFDALKSLYDQLSKDLRDEKNLLGVLLAQER